MPIATPAVLTELAALVGMLTLELAGHFVGSADPADHLYAALLDRQVATLGLPEAAPASSRSITRPQITP